MIKLGIMFSGQGSQYTGMGRSLANTSAIARRIFDQASDILGYDLNAMMDQTESDRLEQTEYAQPAIFVYSYAWYQTLAEEFYLTPSCGAGHSLGEFTALACAGILSFDEALRLIQKRGISMQHATESGFGRMAAIKGVHVSVIEEVCARLSDHGQLVQISNYNSDDQIVISGESQQVQHAIGLLAKLGGTAYPLHVSAPFHTPYMNSANVEFAEALQHVNFANGSWPVISNVDAQPYRDKEHVRAGLESHMLRPVRWSESIAWMLRQGVNVLVELGPRSALRNTVRQAYPHIRTFSIDHDYDEILEILRVLQHQSRPTVTAACLSMAQLIPNRNSSMDEYTSGVIHPCQQLMSRNLHMQHEGRPETEEERREALQLLRGILRTKRATAEEAWDCYIQISDQTGLPLSAVMQENAVV
ncbi:ACP S-malonyltransferase [Paenibacillus sp. P96]|uniref:[acyl-carrier-protein] S-malonyltransferase n=1 Tax=Paenibacillus zeirhizosphaerae TaxID=2987519 RepID=A0ABT9FWD4_9BACL|nr:ACP S-malonyltransferase [Paenibacillus sp. P96]MDP4098846.1 ACP S-malonyltransferase [Paenibacillus sp. P96]